MMTSVLRDSLGGNCMTTMIATLSMEKRNIDESISTCRFAQRVALIKNEALLNEEIDPQLMIVRLKKEIRALKDELALVTGERRTDDLTQEETLRLDEQIHNFLDDGDPESTLDIGADMRKIHYCFTLLKRLFCDRKPSDVGISSPETTTERPGSSIVRPEEMKKLRDLLQQRDNEINILVSMLKKEKKRNQDATYEMSQSGGQLRSHSDASLGGRPAWKTPLTPKASSLQQVSDSMPIESRPVAFQRRAGEKMSLGRQEAFEIFKRDYPDRVGIEDNKALLKQRFAEAKSLGEEVNNVRSRINHLKGEVEKRRMQRAALGVSSSSDELNEYDPAEDELRGQMEDEKKRYKTLFNRLKSLKTEIEHLQLLLEKAKVKLLKDFEEWWSEEASDLQNKTELNASSIAAPPRSLSSRVPRSAKTPIPLTGDSQTDADILAFVKARQNLLQRKGSAHQ
ncbi:kinesin-like protein KIF6 [Aquarana catesbeiana]|uniref:kinesin-like protein KIF6 n=1 Tax=Aquarana catesbeiana TaxID=8400 RepID=UPI003CC96F1B